MIMITLQKTLFDVIIIYLHRRLSNMWFIQQKDGNYFSLSKNFVPVFVTAPSVKLLKQELYGRPTGK